MIFKAIVTDKNAKAALVGALVALLAWLLCPFQLGSRLADLSYDLPLLLTTPSRPADLVIVEMDESSHEEFNQHYGTPWNRSLHARLVDHLRRDDADLVVFDIVFTDPDPVHDPEFARAIGAHGRVVLAAGVNGAGRDGIVGERIQPPTDVLREATPHWGPTQIEIGGDGVVRRIYPGTELKPAMSWVAASLARDTRLQGDERHFAERWIRFYGPGGSLARVSYSRATNQPPGFYRGKTVFIGGGPKTRFVAEEVDEFLTPWRRRGQPQISGLELTATEFANLRRGEALQRIPSHDRFVLLACFGLLAGGGLPLLRPRYAVVFACVGGFAVFVFALVLFFRQNLWFDWALPVLVQLPMALAWSLGLQWWRMKKEKEFLEAPLPGLWDDAMPSEKSTGAIASASSPVAEMSPAIPDHVLLRQVGRGAYGDVWLARDVIGSFHAVKIVRRMAFDHSGPYEREFRGLQRFTPVSRAHPGLVQILHVGRNTAEDFFYYVMEAGDDEKTGPAIDPERYTPRNLGRDLRQRAPLSPGECVAIVSALCEALEFLHGQGLIHRDIKPANIIFVNGRPKLADIGLVTDIADGQNRISLVGTEGYLPPEGPGTVSGDIFALGRVIEEMLRRGTDTAPPPDEARERLLSIASRACATDPAERFASAREMREALEQSAGGDEK